MAGTTTAFCTSAKVELAKAVHNFTTTSGNVFYCALIKVSPAGTYGAGSTNYSNITGNSDEVSGTGYTATGYHWTQAQNTTPTSTGTTAFWTWSVNPSWTTATFSATAAMIYNNTASGASVSTHDFGGTQTVTAGTFTLQLPTSDASTSILRLA